MPGGVAHRDPGAVRHPEDGEPLVAQCLDDGLEVLDALLEREVIDLPVRHPEATLVDPVATRDTLKSMGLSRGASALGVALALGETAREPLTDAAIGADTSLWSGRASASAGIELMNHEIVVLGNASGWTGDLVIRVMPSGPTGALRWWPAALQPRRHRPRAARHAHG